MIPFLNQQTLEPVIGILTQPLSDSEPDTNILVASYVKVFLKITNYDLLIDKIK